MAEGLDRRTWNANDDNWFGENSYKKCLTEELIGATQALVTLRLKVHISDIFPKIREALNVIARERDSDFQEFIFAGSEESLTNACTSIVTNIKPRQDR